MQTELQAVSNVLTFSVPPPGAQARPAGPERGQVLLVLRDGVQNQDEAPSSGRRWSWTQSPRASQERTLLCCLNSVRLFLWSSSETAPQRPGATWR